MTLEVLHVHEDERTIEIYMNDKDDIYFGEVDEDNPYRSWMTFSFEDWQTVKEFVDKQFELYKD